MASKKNIESLKAIKKELDNYSVIGILNMHKLPAGQLYEIREKLREQAKIRMVKKKVMLLALEQDKRGLKPLKEFVEGEPAFLLSNANPFDLARDIAKAKSKAFAKTGDIAPEDLIVKAGPTPLPPGPAIGDFQKLKIPAGVEGDKIAVKKETTVVKRGEEINEFAAGLFSKLGIKPIDISLNLRAAWEQGFVYKNEVMFTPPEKYLEDLRLAASQALNLTVEIGLPTKQNIEMLIAKAHMEANALAIEAGILTKETVKPMLAKADAQAKALKGLVKEPEKPTAPDAAETEKKPAEDAAGESDANQKAEEKKGTDNKEEKE